MDPNKQIVISPNLGRLESLQFSGSIKSDPAQIEDKILASPIDFVNYVEIKIPEKDAKAQKDSFPLKKYEAERKPSFTLSELNPKDDLASKIYTEEKGFIFFTAFEDKIVFGDESGNIKFYSFKEKKVTMVLTNAKNCKSYAMDILLEKNISLVGYENGQIAIFDKPNNQKFLNKDNNPNIINIKFIEQKDKIQALFSDIKGNVMLINIKKGKAFFGKPSYNAQIEKICQSNENAPFYVINPLNLKAKELATKKYLNDIDKVIVLANTEKAVFYTYSDKFKVFDTFIKPKYIKNNSLPDVCLGLGKQPSLNVSTEEDAELLLLYLISWDKYIYLSVVTIMNKHIEFILLNGYYINEEPIVRIGFFNLSTVYMIDKKGFFKILNTRGFVPGFIEEKNIEENIIPPENNKAELQIQLHMENIRKHYYLGNNSLESYLYSIINNKSEYEFFAFGEKTIYQQSLINYKTYLDNLYNNKKMNEFFILGKNVYRGKMNALEGIPIKIDDRKKKVKKDLQDKINNYIDSLINTNKFEKKLEKIIEFSLDIDSIDFLIKKMMKSNNFDKFKQNFLLKLEPFILCDKLIDADIPKNIIFELIEVYKSYNALETLDKLLLHFNLKSLNLNDIMKKFEELGLVSPQSNILINGGKHDYLKPAQIMFEKFMKSENLASFTDYVDLIKKKKIDLDTIMSSRQYMGHKLMWYLQKTFDGRKFPYFIEYIEPSLYFSASTKLAYWLLNDKVFTELILLDLVTFFNIIIFVFSNEDIIETFEEINEDPEKKSEALKILKGYPDSSYKSEDVDLSDLITHIKNMGNELLKKDSNKYEKINLYLKIFEITVGKRMNLDVQEKKEAVKFIIQNMNKYQIKIDLSKKMLGILEGKDFELKHYDEILYVMKKGSFDEIRLFILKKKKLYIDCLNLLFDEEVKINKVDETTFTFINMTLTRLQIKKDIVEYKKFKAEVKKNLLKILEKSVENCYTIINIWFKKDKKACLDQLKQNPQLQLNYIEYTIKKIIEAKKSNEIELDEEESYIKYVLEKHVSLLCSQNRKNEIITWLKNLDDYPIKECIKICDANDVYDALIFLYKKEGNITDALQVCNKVINDTFNQILNIFKSEKLKESEYNSKKEEFIKFIDDTIETIEADEKENENVDADKEEDKHKYWKDILSRLYRIQDKFSKEPNDKEDKKEIYSDISELILNQIQNLISRMAPYVGGPNILDFVFKVNPKAKLREFKPFFFSNLKNYGIEINILNFILETINDYSLEQQNYLESLNENGESFELNKDYCNVCNNFFDAVNLSAKIVRFKCSHMQHFNCGVEEKICMKCLEDNYKKWACKKINEKSQEANEKAFVEFLKTYDKVKKEMGEKKEKKEEKKKASKKTGFSKNFRKLMAIDNYNNKNRKNFLIEGIKLNSLEPV